MKIAVDGGAFQQQLAAGILNVAVGLLNALNRADPTLAFVLVIDPRLGPVQERLLSRLDVRPEIVEGEVGPAYGRAVRTLTTSDPRPRFEIDGRIVEPVRSGEQVVYEGPPPKSSFKILSRADTPRDTLGSDDGRCLGMAVRAITIEAGESRQLVSIHDRRLSEGFHPPERTLRWTMGAAVLPRELFGSGADTVRVVLDVSGHMRYRVSEGVFDRAYAGLVDRSERSALSVRTAELESRLLDKGVSAYLVNHFIPAKFGSLKTFAILYDVIPVLFPQFHFGDAHANFAHNMSVFEASDHIFSISEASRTDLLKATAISPERVTAVAIDIAPNIQRQPDEIVREVQVRHGIEGRPYIITVATLEPRKNHRRLIQAYAAVSEPGEPPCDLVIVGRPGWGTEGLHQLVADLGLGARVKFLTEVSNQDLAALYSGALFSAYPSLYEGFGLPVLEAMACGCAVLTSNRSSMPEIASDAAYLVDPNDTESIAQGLRVLMVDPALREMLVARGHRRRLDFSWDVSARRVLNVLARG